MKCVCMYVNNTVNIVITHGMYVCICTKACKAVYRALVA